MIRVLVSSKFYSVREPMNGRIIALFRSLVCATIFAESIVNHCFYNKVEIYHGLNYVTTFKLK